MSQAQDRWQLYGGRDPRELPSYTSRDAARYVRLPLRTVQNWSFGFGTYGGEPLIHVENPKHHLLSFWNVAELHVIGALRRYYRMSPWKLRCAIRYLEETFNSRHPLLTEDMLTDGVSIFVEKAGALINATKSGQLEMRQLMRVHLERIEQDIDGLAIRLFPFVRHNPNTARELALLPDEPKIISLDPRVRFGRPVIVGTSIPTEEVAERFRAGDTCGQIADEYGRPSREIEEAIRCELRLDRAA